MNEIFEVCSVIRTGHMGNTGGWLSKTEEVTTVDVHLPFWSKSEDQWQGQQFGAYKDVIERDF